MIASVERAIERRPFIRLTAGALAAAAGCRRNTDRAYSRRNTLIAGVNADDEGALNPDELPSTLLFLPLVRVNDHGDRQPCLAISWEHSADYLEWTYRLRTAVRWHDGRPVTAEDVKATIDAWSSDFLMGTACTVQDASTVTVSGGTWANGTDEYVGILPKHLIGNLDPQNIYGWDFWLRPVGNGPYRFLRRQSKTTVELEANPDYYKGKPSISRVVLKLITKHAGLTELLAGNVDTIRMYVTPSLPVIANDRRFRTYWRQASGIRELLAFVWQNEHPLFREPDVRRALSLAINRRELAQVLYLPRQSSVVDGLYTMRQLQRGQAAEPPFDPTEARRLLEASGWLQRTPGAVRERKGQAFRFTALAMPGPDTDAAVYLQEQMRGLGLRMELQRVDLGILRNRLKTKEFEAAVCSLDFIWGIFLRMLKEQSPLGYRNPRLKKLLDGTEKTADPEVLDDTYRQISDILRADQPVALLARNDVAFVAHRRVKGLSAPWHSDPLMFTEDLWLDDRRDG